VTSWADEDRPQCGRYRMLGKRTETTRVSDARLTPSPSAASVQAPLEVVVSLRQHCTTHVLPRRGTVRVGRDALSDIWVDDPSASRSHFALHIEDEFELKISAAPTALGCSASSNPRMSRRRLDATARMRA